ncbi:MAG: hypothetical protein IJ660_05785 [Alphaproteobacteria bacterium]|nr:hypothetical protein [Alphaproteobacteria bacterium]
MRRILPQCAAIACNYFRFSHQEGRHTSNVSGFVPYGLMIFILQININLLLTGCESLWFVGMVAEFNKKG